MTNPKHTNRLINETSPYLLQHAHNPVEWFAWSAEAFEKAVSEDKPVLISIGYSACHWCHVMEHESFEDEATAALMNAAFVNIKIDLEERPDVDQIYMRFVQMTTGSGGYPLNVFLTPEKLPFFGGTYFPPVSRYNMPSFRRILSSIKDAWQNNRAELLKSGSEILDEMRQSGLPENESLGSNASSLNLASLDAAYQNFTRSFDRVNGGFGGAPKFPPSMSLEFLLRHYHRTMDENALEMVEKTCLEMASGGIYDQLGGGFHRYTVDAVWLVPHFEKMLYDNAQLARIYLHLFQITQNDFYKRIAVETLEYVKREMLDADGGFYAAQDADSEGVEGRFFVWTPAEIAAVLGDEEARIFNFYFDVTEHGNFEEKNILNVRSSPETAARQLKLAVEKLHEIIERGRKLLFGAREQRIKPFRDEKILTAWNGLMLKAFAEASAILDNDEYLAIAERNAEFILRNLKSDNRLLRTWKNGQAKLNAYLEDYADFADGLIELFQVSGATKYLHEAIRLADLMIAEFWDQNAGGFYFTGKSHEQLVMRSKDFYDNATPSGNSVAADVLLKLAAITGDEKYERYSVALLEIIAPQIVRYAPAFGRVLSAMDFYLNSTKEIVVVGEKGSGLEKEVWRRYLPNKIVILAGAEPDESIPLLKGRTMINGGPTAYVCENYVCQKPSTTVGELAEHLSRK